MQIKPAGFARAVNRVTEQRMACMREVGANLMPAAFEYLHQQQRIAVNPAHRADPGPAQGVVLIRGHAHDAALVVQNPPPIECKSFNKR